MGDSNRMLLLPPSLAEKKRRNWLSRFSSSDDGEEERKFDHVRLRQFLHGWQDDSEL
jgi:hypothetical protein